MKFTLAALIASTVSAAMGEYGDLCYGDWEFEDCSRLYRRYDYCNDVCGWWYSPGSDEDQSDDLWATCDEPSTWSGCWVSELVMASRKVAEKRGANPCSNGYNWDYVIERSQRWTCDKEDMPTSCGRYTIDSYSNYEYWLRCETYDAINDQFGEPCDKVWYQDDILDAEWRDGCAGDPAQSAKGKYFRFEEGADEFWVFDFEYSRLITDYGEDECDNDWEFDERTGTLKQEACEDQLPENTDCAWFLWNPLFQRRIQLTCDEYYPLTRYLKVCQNGWQGAGYDFYREPCDWELEERDSECGRFIWSYEIYGEVFEAQPCDERGALSQTVRS